MGRNPSLALSNGRGSALSPDVRLCVERGEQKATQLDRGTNDKKLTHRAAGTFAIAPTPFHDDGRIDEKSIDRLTDFYAEVGCDGVTVLGILGRRRSWKARKQKKSQNVL